MINTSDYHEGSIAQKLNFTTPQKERNYDWKVGTDSLCRNLFDSHKKPNISNQVRLVVPLILVDVP